MRIKTGDQVVVITGNDARNKNKNIPAKVVAAKHTDGKVIVEGRNMVKKHMRQSEQYPDGGVIEVEAPIKVSNVMLVDPSTGERTRVGYKMVDGVKVRYAKKSGQVLNEVKSGKVLY